MLNNNCKKTQSSLLKEAEQKFNEWFFSDEGEIVAEPHSNALGQYGVKRRTESPDGTAQIRYSVTRPDGSSQQVVNIIA